VFKVFGIYSLTSAVVLLAINSVFSALTCIPIFWIARRCFSERVALWTCWLWALLPPIMTWATRWVWETSIAAFLLTLLFWLTLVMEECESSLALWGIHQVEPGSEIRHTRLLPWAIFGLLWAAAALLNTSLLAFLPVSGLWIWWHRWKQGKSSLAGIVLASIVFLACISPWTIRNYHTFGKLFLIRSNFGAELRLGNGPGADGTWMQRFHPTQNAHEMSRYRGMGEMDYIAVRKQEAYAFIREDWTRFLMLCGKRFVYYWAGVPRPSQTFGQTILRNSLYCASSLLTFWGLYVAWRRRKSGVGLFLWLILFYPLVYYVVFPHPRYRHPIEPEMGMLIVFGIVGSEEHEPNDQQNP
jgi:4-amino-4-deoxy-L-arabinose transferase-like glycosyltransferase